MPPVERKGGTMDKVRVRTRTRHVLDPAETDTRYALDAAGRLDIEVSYRGKVLLAVTAYRSYGSQRPYLDIEVAPSTGAGINVQNPETFEQEDRA
jgi:hypothetical protein